MDPTTTDTNGDTTQSPAQRRPIPTTEDIMQGVGGAQSGYLDSSYLDALKQYSDWEIERIRPGRRPFVDDRLPLLTQAIGPVLDSKLASFLGVNFKFSEGQDHKVHHAYVDLLLRNPVTGEKELVRVEKGPHVKFSKGGHLAGVDGMREARALEMSGAPLSFREFTKKTLDTHASIRGNDLSAIGRYRIVNQNCQDFSIAALSAAGVLDEDTRKFIHEANVGDIPKWVENLINKISNR